MPYSYFSAENYSVCKTSSDKRNHLRLIYLLHLHLDSGSNKPPHLK